MLLLFFNGIHLNQTKFKLADLAKFESSNDRMATDYFNFDREHGGNTVGTKNVN